jgi:hypothetical protein
MNMHINQLVKSLFKKESLEHCSLQEVQSFADSNPHFGAAQLLLTKKLKTEKPEQYNQQLQKTFLFFHNPLWVEQLMNDTGSATIIANPNTAINVEENEVSNNAAYEAMVEPLAQAPITTKAPELVTTNSSSPTAINDIVTSDTTPQILEEINSPTKAPELTTTGSSTSTAIGDTVAIDTRAEMLEEKNISTKAPETGNTELPAAGTPLLTLSPKLETGNSELTFEPYHTVDYFAALGIKLKQDEKPVDKFGQQVKSFTDWLKVLRKTPTSAIAQHINPVSEKKVEQMAQHSLTEKEIITEAMAEVWAKQGNTQKAIALYTKLSLQEPDKSVYFASLIEELKKTL